MKEQASVISEQRPRRFCTVASPFVVCSLGNFNWWTFHALCARHFFSLLIPNMLFKISFSHAGQTCLHSVWNVFWGKYSGRHSPRQKGNWSMRNKMTISSFQKEKVYRGQALSLRHRLLAKLNPQKSEIRTRSFFAMRTEECVSFCSRLCSHSQQC